MSLPCPACGFLTVPQDSYGTYNVCEVCGWEDDPAQLANPACGGGANKESLIDAQTVALQRFPLFRNQQSQFCRNSLWRPLETEEISLAEEEKKEKAWRNEAIIDPRFVYWNKK